MQELQFFLESADLDVLAYEAFVLLVKVPFFGKVNLGLAENALLEE